MKSDSPQHLAIETGRSGPVSALLSRPAAPRACYVFAHGAGAGMTHAFMETFANGLFERGIASLRYQFPYMEKGSKRPDLPAIAQATVRAAVAKAAEIFPGVALIAGGKSFGGRMTSQAQASNPLPGVRGLVFLGFPLHAPKEPSAGRAAHLARIEIPMLFLQGARDEFATQAYLLPVIESLGACARLELFSDADHSFHVPVRSGRTDIEIREEVLGAIAAFSRGLGKDS